MSRAAYASEAMTDQEFESAVRGMRAAQNRYFATPYDDQPPETSPKKKALVQARTLEARVDRELKRREQADKTPSLFDEAVVSAEHLD